MIADAKPGAVGFYERLGFVRLGSIREGLGAGEPVPMFLDIDTILRAT